MSKSKLSIITTSLRQQLAIGFATMTVLPLLALCYFILCYLYPNIRTKESIPLVIVLAIVVSLLGFSVVSRIIRSVLQLARYLEAVAAGDLTQKIEIHNGNEIGSITRSLNLILERIQKDQQERAEAEAARVTTEIIQCLPDSLVVLNLDGEVTSVNPAYLKMFGHKTENEVLGISIDGFQEAYCNPEKDIPRSLELFKEVIEKGFTEEPIEIRLRKADGREFFVSASASLLKDAEGSPKNVVAILRDITELKRAEEERIAAVRERAAVIDAIPDGLVVLDLNGTILSENPAMLKIFGYEPEERVGKSFDELNDLKPEDIERFMKLLGELIEKDHVEPIETVIRAKDGRGIPTSVTYSLLRDVDGNPKNIIALLRDITELKRAEEERTRLAAERVKVEEDKKRMAELEKFTKVAVGRELKMKQMEKELATLRSATAKDAE